MADERAKRASGERPDRRDDEPEQKRPRAEDGDGANDPLREEYSVLLRQLIYEVCEDDGGDVAMDSGDGVEDGGTDASDDDDEDTPLAALRGGAAAAADEDEDADDDEDEEDDDNDAPGARPDSRKRSRWEAPRTEAARAFRAFCARRGAEVVRAVLAEAGAALNDEPAAGWHRSVRMKADSDAARRAKHNGDCYYVAPDLEALRSLHDVRLWRERAARERGADARALPALDAFHFDVPGPDACLLYTSPSPRD